MTVGAVLKCFVHSACGVGLDFRGKVCRSGQAQYGMRKKCCKRHVVCGNPFSSPVPVSGDSQEVIAQYYGEPG